MTDVGPTHDLVIHMTNFYDYMDMQTTMFMTMEMHMTTHMAMFLTGHEHH